MNKLNVCIMGQNCEKFLPMCLNSVKDADNIIYCDGGSTDNTLDIIDTYHHLHVNEGYKVQPIIIKNKYNQEDKGMNGKQRNFYLSYLKKHHMGEFCICIDADEVVEDISKIKELINNPPEGMKDIISVKMRHFIGNLGTEDATVKEHYVPHRLFKIKEELIYPETEHCVLVKKVNGKLVLPEISYFNGTVIWHLAYITGMFDIRKKYLNHLKKSEMHSKEFLNNWYSSHLFGIYPNSRINAMEIPEVILNEFLIEKDMIYYSTHNQLETKHFIMSKQWIDYFKPKKVLELGCGLGMFGFALDSYEIDYTGMEKSQWAIDNTKFKLNLNQGDITKKQDYKDFDLVLVLDVLEHIKETDLDKTLENIKEYGTKFLFSIPYIDDPNIDLDITHVTKKSKEWWVTKLSQFFKIKDVPNTFLYNKQLLIGE